MKALLYLNKINTAAGESFLRRILEAIFDIGRHILAKRGHLDLSSEYKSIVKGLVKSISCLCSHSEGFNTPRNLSLKNLSGEKGRDSSFAYAPSE